MIKYSKIFLKYSFAQGILLTLGVLLSTPVKQLRAEEVSYTCSMHPQVRLPNPGNCPICSMPLVPAQAPQKGQARAGYVELSEQAQQMAAVETTTIVSQELFHLVRAVGKISYDETSLATITARVDGYAERLFVNFTGVEVSKNDHLAEVYSPDLVIAQQELLVAAGALRPGLLESTKIKLHRLGLTDGQISELLQQRKVTERITLLSPITGTVIARNVTQNAAFKSGDILYQIANLASVWAYLDIYESQLPWLRYGQHVTMTTEALPGRTFEGKVTFISPVVDEETRTVKVPVHIANLDHALKPGMFVSAEIHSAIDSQGKPAPTGAEGLYTCPMHPQIMQEMGGSCSLCGMDLKKVPGHKGEGKVAAVLAVPASAVLDGGQRKLVYVEKTKGVYESREVTLGPRAGDYFPVLQGLTQGERVAIRGNFLLDSQAQISGAPSLFYPQGAFQSDTEQAGAAGAKKGSVPATVGHKH